MKKKFHCPACGARELSKLFITTHKGTKLSLLLSSQANIRKSTGEAMCENCKNVWRIVDTHNKTQSERMLPGHGGIG
jgi:predicted nucleic-acid-binding Zn-ribbon protein